VGGRGRGRQGGRTRGRGGSVALPAMKGARVHRITVGDQLTGRLLAATGAGTGSNKLEMFLDATGRVGAELDPALNPIALNDPVHLWLRISITQSFPSDADPVFRLFDADGDW